MNGAEKVAAKPDTTPRCQNCGEAVGRTYWNHSVNAVERTLDIAPDGGSMSQVVRSALTCSWRCLAAVIGDFAERDQVEEPF